ncbi:MAG: TM2 domain-containing protein [Bacteroidales bacterium]|nr:TM2 domain-containing protein [Bacteroidales bacterium]MBO7180972.1 TM2 domain-containing protein [Bacteroidales bacterium]
MNTNFVNPNANFAVSLLTSVLGVDRFVIGQTNTGLLKLLTAGGLGVWAIIDWFQIKELTQEYNFNKAEEIIYIIKD